MKFLVITKDSSNDVFRRVQTSVQNLTPQMIFSSDELHIILKHMNLEICEHLSFHIFYLTSSFTIYTGIPLVLKK